MIATLGLSTHFIYKSGGLLQLTVLSKWHIYSIELVTHFISGYFWVVIDLIGCCLLHLFTGLYLRKVNMRKSAILPLIPGMYVS